jgi:hypothetical protein
MRNTCIEILVLSMNKRVLGGGGMLRAVSYPMRTLNADVWKVLSGVATTHIQSYKVLLLKC